MSDKLKGRQISINYLPVEEELDASKPLEVGKGLTDMFIRSEDLGYKTMYGVKRYMCGLDKEIVNYDSNLTDEQKKAKIDEIEKIITRLESVFGKGSLDPTNREMWSQVKLLLDKKETPLNISEPKTEILLYCIRAGGFSGLVAPTLDEAKAKGTQFYLVEPEELAESKVASRKILDKATAALVKLDESKGYDDIFYIAKYVLPVDKAYTKRTPKAMLYDDLTKFLDGGIVRQSKVRCAEDFLAAIKASKQDIIVTCSVKDAIDNGYLYINPQGEIKNNETGGVYGTTIERAVAHLLNPAYEHELDNVRARVIKKWSE